MEFDLFNNPHSHQLIYYQEGKLDGNGQNQNVCCFKCHQPWHPPSFSCSDCTFLIHQSCLDLPPMIHTPFHPHHKRSLSLTTNNNSCNCCGQVPHSNAYRCPECSFQIDVQCAIVVDTKAKGIRQTTASGKLRHFSHPHPLTLVEEQHRGTRKVYCFLCTRHIESGSTYFCSLCDYHCHSQCAEMHREILNLDYHHHPLFLFALPWKKNTLCDNCKDECNRFFYGCPRCDFSLHLHCLSSCKHQHNFKHFKKLLRHGCQVCGTSTEDGVDWRCSICNLLAHGECTVLPSSLQTSRHPHSLELTCEVNLAYNICTMCGLNIIKPYAGYVCRDCNYATHVNCAKNIQIQTAEGKEEGRNYSMSSTEAVVDSIPNNHFNLENGISHFSHEHKLTLCPFEDNKHCNGCMQCISTQFYGCPPCSFYLHEECAILPRQHMTSFHSHELSMVYIPDFIFLCAVCQQYCHGFAYHCEKCQYTIDIRCAVLVVPLTHPSHNHPLSHFRIKKGYGRCGGCGGWLQNKVGCVGCGFSLDFKCAHLPLAVRNRFDEHPLSLTCVNDEGEYYCDICEEKREKNKWFYSCKLCRFAAHLNCVLGDYPFLKSAKFEGHHHPLSLVKEGKKGYSACGECGDSCEGNLAFECGDLSCKFNVHAFGSCYHNQLTQGRITFTMPSLRYRSVPLYLDPVQREGSKFILLGQHGGRNGSTWNERVLLAIRQFMVSHKHWDDSVQIQYEENEKSFWSTKHGEDGDSKSKKHHKDGVGRKVTMLLGQHYGLGGVEWEDEVFSSIKQVVIAHDGKCIVSIQTQFIDDNGILFWSARHGANGGQKVEVELEHPDEYLMSIYGRMTHVHNKDNYVVGTLTLESNKRIYGPFGDKESKGIRFCFPSGGAKIVGFHGRCGYYLDSIGVKVVPIHNHNF